MAAWADRRRDPFIMFPTSLEYDEKPVIGAEQVHKLLKKWRYDLQPRTK